MSEIFKKPNVKGPRFRKYFHVSLNYKLHREFIEKYPEYKDVTYAKFKEMITVFNQTLWRAVIDERDGIELPASLGHVMLLSCDAPKKRENIDFGKSTKTGIKVLHRNLHTDGKLVKVYYSNSGTVHNFKHKKLWSLKPSRDFSRTITKEYPKNWQKYRTKEYHIRGYRDKVNKKQEIVRLARTKPATKGYNEFDMD